MFGCASEETELRHPFHAPGGNPSGEEIDVRKNGDLWWLRPDGMTSHSFCYQHSFAEFVRVESNPHVRVQRLPSRTFVLTDMHSGVSLGFFLYQLCFLCLGLACALQDLSERLVIIIRWRKEKMPDRNCSPIV